tara:strand:+ start:930 stop:1643 length:714 start_codon:yes stop_codon:yes gene_type:complete
MQNNDNFRWDYTNWVINQPYSWYTDYYNRNFLFKYNISSWDFYWNRYQIWGNWGFNSNLWFGWDWYRPYGYSSNNYGYAWNWSRSNYPYYWNRWNKFDRFNYYDEYNNSPSISYSATPRGSRGVRNNKPRKVLNNDGIYNSPIERNSSPTTNTRNYNVDNIIKLLRRNGIEVRHNQGRNIPTPGSTLNTPRNNTSTRNISTRSSSSNRNSSSVRSSSSSSSKGSSPSSGGSRGCAKC